MWSYNYMSTDELYHHGVLGMKWGVHRAKYKSGQNSKLEKKALKYDKQSADYNRQSEKAHAKNDLGASNRAAYKAATYAKRAAKVSTKALKATTDTKKVSLEKKAAKLEYKSATNQRTANRLSKLTGYGSEAMRLSVKSDTVASKAAKARLQIASNQKYILLMDRKLSEIS